MEESKFQKWVVSKTKTVTTIYSDKDESLAKFIRKTLVQLLNDYFDSGEFKEQLSAKINEESVRIQNHYGSIISSMNRNQPSRNHNMNQQGSLSQPSTSRGIDNYRSSTNQLSSQESSGSSASSKRSTLSQISQETLPTKRHFLTPEFESDEELFDSSEFRALMAASISDNSNSTDINLPGCSQTDNSEKKQLEKKE